MAELPEDVWKDAFVYIDDECDTYRGEFRVPFNKSVAIRSPYDLENHAVMLSKDELGNKSLTYDGVVISDVNCELVHMRRTDYGFQWIIGPKVQLSMVLSRAIKRSEDAISTLTAMPAGAPPDLISTMQTSVDGMREQWTEINTDNSRGQGYVPSIDHLEYFK